MGVEITVTGGEVSKRWPHLRQFLRTGSAGRVEDNFRWWHRVIDTLSPVERAAAYEEWADFWEWRLERRTEELAGDRVKRHLVEQWTDGMAYCCRRSAALARDEDPGEWIPQWERRPDLDAEGRAIVDEIVARLEPDCQPATRHLRRVG